MAGSFFLISFYAVHFCAFLIVLVAFSIVLFVWFNFGQVDSFQRGLYAKWIVRNSQLRPASIDPIQIVITSDEKRTIGMMALINSVVSNTKHPVFFYLITIPSNVDHLRRWIDGSKLKGIKYDIGTYSSSLSFINDSLKHKDLDIAKLYIPIIFPTIRGIVLFLDNDCIVLSDIKDLAKAKVLQSDHYGIFSSDCESTSKRLSVIPNKYSSYVNTRNRKLIDLGIDPRKCTFSTGVFVVNLTDWIRRNVTSQLDYWMWLGLREDIFVRYEAKSAMMIVFYRKITNMDPSWHVRHLGTAVGSRYSKRFVEKAKLLHWDGQFKPWTSKASCVEFWDPYYVPDPTGKHRIARRKKWKTDDGN